MTVSKDQAIQIATDFVQQHQKSDPYPLRLETQTVRHCRGGYGTDSLGMGATYWSVMFELATPDDVVVCPGEVIVLVDEESGRAAFHPLL